MQAIIENIPPNKSKTLPKLLNLLTLFTKLYMYSNKAKIKNTSVVIESIRVNVMAPLFTDSQPVVVPNLGTDAVPHTFQRPMRDESEFPSSLILKTVQFLVKVEIKTKIKAIVVVKIKILEFNILFKYFLLIKNLKKIFFKLFFYFSKNKVNM